MDDAISRRTLLRSGTALAAVLLLCERSLAEGTGYAVQSTLNPSGTARLTPDDDLASAVSYHDVSAHVDSRQFESFRAGQNCSNCIQSKATDSPEWRVCALFPDKLVSADGWCEAYYQKK